MSYGLVASISFTIFNTAKEIMALYGGRGNPYDQRGGAPGGGYDGPAGGYDPPTGSYNAPQRGRYDSPQRGDYNPQPYGAPPQSYGGESRYNDGQTMGRDQYGTNVEMEPLAPNGASFAPQGAKSILERIKEVREEIKSVLVENYFVELENLQNRAMSDVDSSKLDPEIDALNAKIMSVFRRLTGEVKSIKQQPESGNPRNASQVRSVQTQLRSAKAQYDSIQGKYENLVKAQIKRNMLLVNKDATQAELDEAANDTSRRPIFAQALMQSTRSGQARSAMNTVEIRHKEIQKIEQQMVELAQLFEQMEALVVEQEAAVAVIEQKGEEVVENLDKGNEQLDSGIKSARSRNRKKWWCLLICVIIIIIIVVVVIIYVKVINPPKSAKRSVIDALQARYITAAEPWTPRGRLALRDTPWTA